MQLSQTAEYALRAVVYLAEHIGDAQTNHQIAEGCRMPSGYLAKVLQPLTKAGIVSAQRGLGGGYALQADPKVLSLLDVVSAVEPVQRFRGCPLKLTSHESGLCALHQTLDDAMAGLEQALRTQTVANILAINGVRPLCEGGAAGGAGGISGPHTPSITRSRGGGRTSAGTDALDGPHGRSDSEAGKSG